jgi:hypothetical protein
LRASPRPALGANRARRRHSLSSATYSLDCRDHRCRDQPRRADAATSPACGRSDQPGRADAASAPACGRSDQPRLADAASASGVRSVRHASLAVSLASPLSPTAQPGRPPRFRPRRCLVAAAQRGPSAALRSRAAVAWRVVACRRVRGRRRPRLSSRAVGFGAADGLGCRRARSASPLPASLRCRCLHSASVSAAGLAPRRPPALGFASAAGQARRRPPAPVFASAPGPSRVVVRPHSALGVCCGPLATG